MAILSVTEEWRSTTGADDANSTTELAIYKVSFDNEDDPRLRRFLVMTAEDPVTHVKIPQGFEEFPGKPWLCVSNRDKEPEGPFDYIVYITYSNRPVNYLSEAPSGGFINPLDEPEEIEFDTYEWNDTVDIDMTGKPIVNKLNDPPDPPLQERMTCLSVRITRNQALFDAILMADYVNSVNTDLFWGFSPGICLCNRISARQMRQGGLIFYRASFEIFINPLKEISGHLVGGWRRRIRHEGYILLVNINGVATRARAKVKQADDDKGENVGEPTPLPVLLNDMGYRLNETTPACWLEFQTKREMPFGNLNL